MNYCINNLKKGADTAGIKAPKDVYEICSECGFGEIKFFEPKRRKSVFLTRILSIPTGYNNWIRLKNMVHSDDWVLIQHPNENILIGTKFISKLKKKGVHFMALIHDLESLRKSLNGTGSELERRNILADNELLRKCDYIICHNDSMKKYLVQKGFDSHKIFELEIFDYLHNCEIFQNRKKEDPIVIAGNLQKGKCDYLYKLISQKSMSLRINVYGPNFQTDLHHDNINYFGSFAPDILPGKLEGSFGLVWDGTELNGCAGNAGEYIKYNNPHKCSLFLAANLPVIIWSQAALAPFIIENGVGFVVDSLNEIENKVSKLSDAEYRDMLNNTRILSNRIRSGYYLKSTLSRIGFNN